ncbi:MAG: class I SAM-dependent methyltransferase [Acidimicrobiales bacterium]|nr:class I SAM-dependent methyltransferase [Acidimicrobiales bacterium]
MSSERGAQTDDPTLITESAFGRFKRKFRRGITIITTPRLLSEQIAYMRHGRAPEANNAFTNGTLAGSDGDPDPSLAEPPADPTPDPVFPDSPWQRFATGVTQTDNDEKGPDGTTAANGANTGYRARAHCNVCYWEGDTFGGPHHVEYQLCPACGSNARDRFLFHCFTLRTPEQLGLRVMETSPRMGLPYREAMATWFRYVCSDFDASCHRAAVQLDLQQLGVRDASIDVLLTPHVLEHVPDTARALAEIHRVLAPGGRMYLQVPVLQGRTAPPAEPEFHGDNTPVFWRFGFDFTARLRSEGFETTLLCIEDWRTVVDAGLRRWPDETAPEFDVASMLEGVVPSDLTVVLGRNDAERLGLWHPYMFLVWECIRPT